MTARKVNYPTIRQYRAIKTSKTLKINPTFPDHVIIGQSGNPIYHNNFFTLQTPLS